MKRYLHNSLKILILSVGFVFCFTQNGWGQIQISEGFESGLPTSYTTTTSYTLVSGTWTGQANGVISGTAGVNSGTYSCQLRSQTGAQITTPNIATGGISTVTFYGSSSTTSGSVQVNYSIDGGSNWLPATGSPFSLTTGATVLKTATINSSSSNILVQFYRTAATVYLDDITINANCTPPSDPSGSITPAANPACTSTSLAYSAPNAAIYWQTTSTGTSTSNPTTSAYTANTSGTYYVRAYNGSCWSTNSLASAAITINSPVNITSQPINQSVNAPATVTFSLTATGTGVTYQWQENTGSGWSNISGATSSSYTTGATTTAMSGYQYQCIVNGTAPCASATSNQATLTVLAGAMWTNPITGTNPGLSNPYTSGQTFDPNITVSGIRHGTGNTGTAANDRYNCNGWSTGGIDLNDYFEFTLTPNSGYGIDFINFIYTGQVSSGSPSFAFRSSLDGFTSNIGSPTTSGTTIDLSSASFQGITSAITFRFYAYGLALSTTTYSINDFTFNGNVTSTTSPLITVSPTVLSGFTYLLGGGPSPSQNYSLSGINLTGFPGNIIVTGSANYQVSLDNTTFSASVNVPYTSATLNATAIYVRLKSGLSAGSYNNEIITNAGGGASTQNVTCNGIVTTITTAFHPGDFALLSVNSNISCLGLGAPYSAGDDQISFMIFKAINPGDNFILTDNGYERLNAGQWGNSEGTYQITRTTSSIPAGTVITIRLLNNAPFFIGVYPDNNWTMVNVGLTSTQCVLNSGGDQFYFMQGGIWNAGTKTGSTFNHDATYTPGVVLYAFNTNSSWTAFVDNTQNSGLILGMECFNLMPGVATDFVEYTGLTTPASKHDWLNRLNEPSFWTNRTDCNTYFLAGNNIHYSQTYSIIAGGYSAGVWTGDRDIDWFNCGNWQNLVVPDKTVDVTIPSGTITNEPTVGAPPTTPVLYTSAECNSLSIQNSRTLTINDASSILDIYGTITNTGTYSHSLGLVNIFGGNTTITPTNPMSFYNLTLNKTLNNNTLTLTGDITISNSLSLTSGVITTGANKVIVSTTNSGAITGYGLNSYIFGNLRRSFASNTNTYPFPLGYSATNTDYHPADIINNSLSLSYIDASVNSITETGSNIDANLNTTQSGNPIVNVAEAAEWNFIPNTSSFTGSYGVNLYVRNISGLTDNQFCPVKRPDGSSNYIDWLTYDGSTTIPASGAAGRITSGGTGYAQRTGYTAFSKHAIGTSLNPLPIELIKFTGEYLNKKIQLLWQTSSETNNDYFQIEKSKDLNSFERIGSVMGAGNSNTTLSYSFIDDSPYSGSNYYKLKQVDFDGKSSESKIIVVTVNQNSLVNMFVGERNQLNISSINLKIEQVEILDVTGKQIYFQQNSSDNETLQINVPDISQGIYFVKIIGDNFTETRKIYFQ